MRIKVKKLHLYAQLPTFAHPGDAADLYAAETKWLVPHEPKLVSVGFSMELPEGYRASIRPRSGLFAKHGIYIHPGTIDNGYRGEVKVGVMWPGYEPTTTMGQGLRISQGDRIAQIVIERIEPVEFEWAEELSETERGVGGFGSTGA